MSSYLRSAFVWAIAIIICFSFLTSTPMADVKFDQQDKQKGNAQQKKIKTGKVLGLVVNSTTGDALPRATVEVVSTGQTVYTDADGNFTLDLEPGTYELKATFEGFIEIRKEVTVSSTDVTPVDIALSQQGVGEVIEVVASSNSAVALLEERRSGTTIADSISREEISKDTGSDAASVLQRAPGLSVVGGKFVYVRGLGDRYSNTVLNDAALPTPLADRRTVPLDQVPSELVQNIKVLKSFTPDQPGEFAGGLVKIETLEIPNKTTFKISSSISANSVTTFRDFLRYPGDRLDFLGFGLGRRDLPSSIPMQQLRRGSALIPGFSADQLQQFGRAFENIWEPRSQRGTVNQNYGISGSKQIGKFG
ncbi:MAG: carboxypeptidase regulatory-like domain-containing protein, partial [Blastocatellia bacterium]|nr:carboxypeptidase regulatory-like domain-containing protein [Blastocatellia bacterium]